METRITPPPELIDTEGLEYGELKMELAYRFSEDIEGYCTGKDAFVKQLEKDALLWYQNNESYKTR